MGFTRPRVATRHASSARALQVVVLEMGTLERVLIVDDNADVAELTSVYLSTLGHETEVVHDGPTCLERARTFHPTVVVLDIGLPLMDGYAVAARLRAEHGHALRLIAASGYSQSSDRIRAIEAGIDEYLVKPVDLELLALHVGCARRLRAG